MSFFDPIIPLIPQLTSNIPQLLPTIYSGSNHSIKPNISYQNQIYQTNEYDHSVNSNYQKQNQIQNNVGNTNNMQNPANVAPKQEQTNPYTIQDNSKVINQVLQFSFNNSTSNANMPYYSPLTECTVNNITQNTHLPINNANNGNIPYYSPLPTYSTKSKKSIIQPNFGLAPTPPSSNNSPLTSINNTIQSNFNTPSSNTTSTTTTTSASSSIKNSNIINNKNSNTKHYYSLFDTSKSSNLQQQQQQQQQQHQIFNHSINNNNQNIILPPVPPTSSFSTNFANNNNNNNHLFTSTANLNNNNNNHNGVLDSIDSILQRQTQYTCFPYRNNFEYLSPSIFDTSNTKGKTFPSTSSTTSSSSTPSSIKANLLLGSNVNVDEVIAGIVKEKSSSKSYPVAIGSEIKNHQKMTKQILKAAAAKAEILKNKAESETSQINEKNNSLEVVVKKMSSSLSNNNNNEKSKNALKLKNSISSTLTKSLLSDVSTISLSHSIINENINIKQQQQQQQSIEEFMDNNNNNKNNNNEIFKFEKSENQELKNINPIATSNLDKANEEPSIPSKTSTSLKLENVINSNNNMETQVSDSIKNNDFVVKTFESENEKIKNDEVLKENNCQQNLNDNEYKNQTLLTKNEILSNNEEQKSKDLLMNSINNTNSNSNTPIAKSFIKNSNSKQSKITKQNTNVNNNKAKVSPKSSQLKNKDRKNTLQLNSNKQNIKKSTNYNQNESIKAKGNNTFYTFKSSENRNINTKVNSSFKSENRNTKINSQVKSEKNSQNSNASFKVETHPSVTATTTTTTATTTVSQNITTTTNNNLINNNINNNNKNKSNNHNHTKNSSISHIHCNMRKALTERNDRVAWQSYKEMAENQNLKDLSHTDFSRILRILRNERGPVRSPNNLNEMVQIIENIKEAGFQPNHGDFTTMIAAFGRSHQLVKALTYFEEMKQANLEPDIFTYNTLIDVYGKNKELYSAVKIFNEMKEKKLKPTLATFNILISAHGLNEDPNGAKYWFDCVVKDHSISANEITYSNIMDAYARVGDVKSTLKYLNEMKSLKINPSLGHYNSLVLVYTKVGDIAKATEILNEMKEKGMEPSPHIYSLLMNAYGENDNISGAFKILYNHHKKPGRSMYHTMIQLYGKKGDLLNAWQTLSQMIQQRITPTPLTWRILASCHGDKPCIIFWSQQVNIIPTAAMYNHFLEYYSKQPNIKAVTLLFDEMIHHQFSPTIETYNSILHAHSILGDSNAVFKIYSELVEKAKLEPNLYTYNILLKVYAKIGDSQSAMALFENEIVPRESNGVIPDAFTYNALLESFNEKFDQNAKKYLDDMKAKGLAPVPHRDIAIMKAIHSINKN